MDILEELKEVLQDRVDDWSDPDREAAEHIARDLANLMAADITGGDDSLEAELEHAKASARNIAVAATLSGAKAFEELVARVADRLLSKFAI